MWGFLFTIGLMVLSYFLRPTVTQKGPRLEDLRVTASTYGNSIKKGWGSNRWGGNYIWVEGNKLVEHKRKKTSNGVTTITYYYVATFAVSWGCGPIEGIRRIWLNDKLVYSVADDNKKIVKRIVGTMTHYLGSETQTPDSYMEGVEGTGKVPAYRGQAYTVFKHVNLENFGNQLPSKVEAEVVAEGTISYPTDVATGYSTIATDEMYLRPWGQPYAYFVHGYNVSVFDILNNNATTVGTTDGGYFGFTVDMMGYIYRGAAFGYPGTTYPLRKYSPTLGYLGQTVDALANAKKIWSDGDIYSSFLTYMGASVPYIWCINTVGNYIRGVQPFIFASSGLSLSANQIVFDSDMWMTYELDSGSNPVFATIDQNGDCWVICSDSILIRCISPPVVVDLDLAFIPSFGNEKWDLSASISNPDYITYFSDDSESFLIVADYGAGKLIKFDLETKTVTATLNHDLYPYNGSAFRTGPTSEGILWLNIDGTNVMELNCKTLTVVREVAQADLGGGGKYANVYDEETHSLWKVGVGELRKAYLDRIANNSVTLSSIITGIAEKMDLAAGDIDVSDLTTTSVDGFSVTGDSTGRQAIESLQSAYFFDGVETDWKIAFPIRTGTSAGTIAEDDLGANVLGESKSVPLLTNREIDIDLPQTIEIKYIDVDKAFETKTQFTTRFPSSMYSRNRESIELPIVMDKDLAKQISEKLLYLTWKQKEGLYEWTMPWKYLKYDPADVITIPYKNNNYLLRITDIQIGANLLMQCKALPDADYCYISNAVGTSESTNVGEEDEDAKNSKAIVDGYFLDIPLLTDDSANDDCGFYVAVQTPYYWYGANIERSNTGYSHFDKVGYIKEESIVGQCTGTLGDIDSTATFDRINTLTIRLFDSTATLSDATELEVLNGSNQCLVGDEILRFQDATDNGDGTWTISTLMRGIRGTEWAANSHIAGERFILLNDTDYYDRIKLGEYDIDETRFYVVMPPDGHIGDHQVLPFVCNAVSKKPYAPCHIAGTRDGSNNLTITWVRRTRIGGEWKDYYDIPIGEDAKNYDIDIYDGATVVRTITATTESATYTAAQQTADGLTPGDQVSLIAYQISAFVDRGYGASATI